MLIVISFYLTNVEKDSLDIVCPKNQFQGIKKHFSKGKVLF